MKKIKVLFILTIIGLASGCAEDENLVNNIEMSARPHQQPAYHSDKSEFCKQSLVPNARCTTSEDGLEEVPWGRAAIVKMTLASSKLAHGHNVTVPPLVAEIINGIINLAEKPVDDKKDDPRMTRYVIEFPTWEKNSQTPPTFGPVFLWSGIKRHGKKIYVEKSAIAQGSVAKFVFKQVKFEKDSSGYSFSSRLADHKLMIPIKVGDGVIQFPIPDVEISGQVAAQNDGVKVRNVLLTATLNVSAISEIAAPLFNMCPQDCLTYTDADLTCKLGASSLVACQGLCFGLKYLCVDNLTGSIVQIIRDVIFGPGTTKNELTLALEMSGDSVQIIGVEEKPPLIPKSPNN